VTGQTGVGKSYLACALGQKACREGHSVAYRRTSRLLDELAQARADGTHFHLLRRLAKTEVVILDDFGLEVLNAAQRKDLLEVLEDRYGTSSTVITSRLEPKEWHSVIGDETIADAICDRLRRGSPDRSSRTHSLTRLPPTVQDEMMLKVILRIILRMSPGWAAGIALCLALPALADEDPEPPTAQGEQGSTEHGERPTVDGAFGASKPPSVTHAPAGFRFEMSGYGDVQFAWYDHGVNQNRAGGAQKDSRLTFDATRFVLELEGELPRYDLEFAAEVEFEHGGTGAEIDLEYEEFGEFETEVEKGGEVVLEELYVQKSFGDRLSLRAGRFYVAVGLLSRYHRPTDYLGTIRSEAEATVVPAVWDELGLQARLKLGWGVVTAQVVNGLDSSGFSSQRWVALGHQQRFELVRATDLAAVARVDVTALPGLVAGFSAYYGGTTRNRPKADLVETCDDPDPGATAPCGYVNAPLLLVDAHAMLHLGRVRASALVLWGHLENADLVSARNERLSNALGVLRTPVAESALALWGEAGVDVAGWCGLGGDHRLEPFLRVDYYDTLFRPRASLFDNPRFERLVGTAGVAYTLDGRVFAKMDFSHRRFGSSDLRNESTARFSTGFVY
jgi:hypothetical protein